MVRNYSYGICAIGCGYKFLIVGDSSGQYGHPHILHLHRALINLGLSGPGLQKTQTHIRMDGCPEALILLFWIQW